MCDKNLKGNKEFVWNRIHRMQLCMNKGGLVKEGDAALICKDNVKNNN